MATVLLELLQECQLVGQVHTLGRAVQRAIAIFSIRADNKGCRIGNPVMLQRISEIEQVNHLFAFIAEKGERESQFSDQILRLPGRIRRKRENPGIEPGVGVMLFLYFRQLVDAERSPVTAVKHQLDVLAYFQFIAEFERFIV